MATYPDFEILINNPEKNRLMQVRRAPVSMLSMIVVFILSVVGVYLFTTFVQSSLVTSFTSFTKNIPRILSLFPVALLLEIMRRLHNDLYIFSLHRLTHLHGRFSLSYSVPVIKYADIRAINVIQDFWGRIFNYGDIAVGTAAHDGNELVILGVKNPEGLALILDKLRSHSMRVESRELTTEIDLANKR